MKWKVYRMEVLFCSFSTHVYYCVSVAQLKEAWAANRAVGRSSLFAKKIHQVFGPGRMEVSAVYHLLLDNLEKCWQK